MYHFRWGPYKASPHEFTALSYKRYFKLSYSLFVPVINSLWDNFFIFILTLYFLLRQPMIPAS
jgi:hypothetical protein